MSGFHEFDITADVHGTRMVFASIEYPADEPPREMVIAGTRYVIQEEIRARDDGAEDTALVGHFVSNEDSGRLHGGGAPTI